MANSQPDRGSNTSKIPSPNPIKHTPIVFFNAPNIFIFPLPFYSLYIILSFLFIRYYFMFLILCNLLNVEKCRILCFNTNIELKFILKGF